MVEITADGGDANNPYVIGNKYLNKGELTINDTYEGIPEYFSFKDNGKPSFSTITITVDENTNPQDWFLFGDVIASGDEFGNAFTYTINLQPGDNAIDFGVIYTGDGVANYSVTIG
jgi:hypothetical protein